MTQRKSSWQYAGVVEVSDEWFDLVPGHGVPRWADARFVDPKGQYPTVVVRAELRGDAGQYRAVIGNLMFGEVGEEVKAAHLRAFGPLMHDLAERVYDSVSLTGLDQNLQPVTPRENFRKVLREASRAPALTMIQREDEVLRRWETEFEPAGMTQREAAKEVGLRYGTFRSYLTHARARRGK